VHHEQYAQNSCDTVYTGNMVCFRYVSVNTLHKGDDDDDYSINTAHVFSLDICHLAYMSFCTGATISFVHL
jgi:hypothetical protein